LAKTLRLEVQPFYKTKKIYSFAAIMDHVRKLENLHIPLWLIKDTCWMLQWKVLGVTMIIPTLLTAIYITYRSRNHNEFFVTLAVSFWISANSYWMCAEFFEFEEYKNFAGIPFVLGMIAVSIFYYKEFRSRSSSGA
jgi:hypothetical protein